MTGSESDEPTRRRVRIEEKGRRGKKLAPSVAADAEDDELPAPCECPRLDPADWDAVESDWSDITFVKTMTNAVLGVPMGFDSTRKALVKKAGALGATVPEDAMLLLGSGRFRRPMMLEVEHAPAGGKKGIMRPGGIVFTRLIEAPWGEMQGKVEQVKDEARARYHRDPAGLWVWYLTCRECSRPRNFETLVVAHYRTAP